MAYRRLYMLCAPLVLQDHFELHLYMFLIKVFVMVGKRILPKYYSLEVQCKKYFT